MKKEIVVQRTARGRRVELQIDGQSVSWADLPYYRLRLGQATLTVGGVAGVFTRPENRGQGREALAALARPAAARGRPAPYQQTGRRDQLHHVGARPAAPRLRRYEMSA